MYLLFEKNQKVDKCGKMENTNLHLKKRCGGLFVLFFVTILSFEIISNNFFLKKEKLAKEDEELKLNLV